MGILHFLNVKSGDCQIIQHPSGRTTVIDVCNARAEDVVVATLQKAIEEALGIPGNFHEFRGHGVIEVGPPSC